MLTLQPLQLCGPVTRVKPATGARVNLEFSRTVRVGLLRCWAARVSAQVNSGVVGSPSASTPIRLCQKAEIGDQIDLTGESDNDM